MKLLRCIALLAVALLIVAMFSDDVEAQCSMCKAVLQSTKDPSFIRGYNLGVLVLLLPPVTIFCSIFIVLRRHKGEAESDSLADKD